MKKALQPSVPDWLGTRASVGFFRCVVRPASGRVCRRSIKNLSCKSSGEVLFRRGLSGARQDSEGFLASVRRLSSATSLIANKQTPVFCRHADTGFRSDSPFADAVLLVEKCPGLGSQAPTFDSRVECPVTATRFCDSTRVIAGPSGEQSRG